MDTDSHVTQTGLKLLVFLLPALGVTSVCHHALVCDLVLIALSFDSSHLFICMCMCVEVKELPAKVTSLSILWILGIELGSLGLTASPLSHQPLLLAPQQDF